MQLRHSFCLIGLVLITLASCGASRNRVPDSSSPSAWQPSATAATKPPVAQAEKDDAQAASTPTETNEVVEPRQPESAPPAEAVAAAPSAHTADDALTSVIARFQGQPPLHAAELLRMWLHRESPKVFDYLEELVLARIVIAESGRLGIRVTTDQIDAKTRTTLSEIERRIQEGSSGMSLDDFIQVRLGLDPEAYKARIREDRQLDLLAERCVRAWLLASERCEVRLIVVETRAKADELLAKLQAGGDFGLLATEYSIEDTDIPPIVRADSPLSRLAFATGVGKWGGPIKEADRFLFLFVDARPEPRAGPWSMVGPAVEESLQESGIADPEYWQWKSMMQLQYDVDMTPFLELVGEAGS